MEEKILEEMEKVEKMGGMVEAVSSGYVQREVGRQAYEFEKKLQQGEITKVGVNRYTEGVDMEVELHEYNDAWAQLQIERLKQLKKERDNKAVTESLKALKQAAAEKKNVMPYLVDCCKRYATVGEMANVFRDVFGEYREPGIF
ncbi:MAG: methylmalonyl-CoA mutase, partial [Proteobacteria bacterium]|nr:methylmalonyl-CoA mutase [Pseudomonadota bacterium]